MSAKEMLKEIDVAVDMAWNEIPLSGCGDNDGLKKAYFKSGFCYGMNFGYAKTKEKLIYSVEQKEEA